MVRIHPPPLWAAITLNQPSKITHAAATGMTYCLGCESSAHAAEEFISLLRGSANWSEPELVEVRRIMLARLSAQAPVRRLAG
jgi:hypothetical protein